MGTKDPPKDAVTPRRASHALYAQKASLDAPRSTTTSANTPANDPFAADSPSAVNHLLRTTTRRGTRDLMAARKLFSVAGLVLMDRLGVAGKHLRGKMGFWSTTIRPPRVGNASQAGIKYWSWGKMDEPIAMVLPMYPQCCHLATMKQQRLNHIKLPYSSCHAFNMLAEVLEPPQTTITTFSSGRTSLPSTLSSLPP
jgi:hypothetical protein